VTRLTTTEARREFSAIVNRAAFGKERLVVHRRGKDLVAVVPVEDLILLESLEDALDLEDARKALADPKNRKRIPWERVKSELGL